MNRADGGHFLAQAITQLALKPMKIKPSGERRSLMIE
jgi:hypothetical protein